MNRHWIEKDGTELTVDDVQQFIDENDSLKSRKAIIFATLKILNEDVDIGNIYTNLLKVYLERQRGDSQTRNSKRLQGIESFFN